MNGKKLLIFHLIFLSCFLLVNNVQSQCEDHEPTEWGKNLVAHMIKSPPIRWSSTTMSYQVNTSTSYWYATDITYAKNVWNSSSYKGTNTTFSFAYAGGTQRSPDNRDYVNVVGFKNIGPGIAASSHTWFNTITGKIYEADIMINSLSWPDIQPHDNAGPNDFCVRNALVHEFGHCLGLSHLYDYQSVEYIPDTMYWLVLRVENEECKKEDLECDDRWGIWYTYDSGSVPPPAPSLPQVSNFSLTRTLPLSTELIGNYPNPFNPDTWIAYKLAKESNVTIRIYDATGKLVRTTQLGVKPAGVYIDKESAAYWDGKTDTGEEVSSGVYFYSLLADQAIYTKKMVIAK